MNTYKQIRKNSITDLDKEWNDFLLQQAPTSYATMVGPIPDDSKNEDCKIPEIQETTDFICDEDIDESSPVCDDLYISTKTKVLFFNRPIDIHSIFWKIPIVEYWKPVSGVTKKQIKVVSKTVEEYEEYKVKLKNIPYYIENIIKQIDNPDSRRIKFKDERKITVGLSKKDVINYRGKVKNAFYNCFALIYRIKCKDVFREIHVKIFNTGKLEIPGILSPEVFETVKKLIIDTIQPYVETKVEFVEQMTDDNILINSNFNCNFFINREKLFNILRSEKYGIESAYDPCSYPGVKCKFYFNNLLGFDYDLQNGQVLTEDRSMKMNELKDNKKYTEISFMIFRTGSCLIVGNCSEVVLKFVFEFVKGILVKEYQNICVANEKPINKNKNTKIIKRIVQVTKEYYNEKVCKI
jgi:hypothetical protein